MDVGFGAVLEKFEEYFGKRTTKLLLILIGLAIAAVCNGAVWQWIVSPILVFIQSPTWGKTVLSFLLASIAIGAGVSVGLMLVSALAQWQRTRQHGKRLKAAQSRVDAAVGEANRLLTDAEGSKTKTQSMLHATVLLASAWVEQNKSLTDEQRAESLTNMGIARQMLEDAETAATKAANANNSTS